MQHELVEMEVDEGAEEEDLPPAPGAVSPGLDDSGNPEESVSKISHLD